MKKLLFVLSCNLIFVVGAYAQKPATEKTDRVTPAWQEGRVVSSSELTPTPEMWFYEQERRRWDDPQALVRAAAEEKAAQRRARLAALAWYGISNSRPQVSPDPTDNPYAPRWRSNSYQPSEWIGPVNQPTIILEAGRGGKNY